MAFSWKEKAQMIKCGQEKYPWCAHVSSNFRWTYWCSQACKCSLPTSSGKWVEGFSRGLGKKKSPDDALGDIKECFCHFILTTAFLGLLLQIHFITGGLPCHSRCQKSRMVNTVGLRLDLNLIDDDDNEKDNTRHDNENLTLWWLPISSRALVSLY